MSCVTGRISLWHANYRQHHHFSPLSRSVGDDDQHLGLSRRWIARPNAVRCRLRSSEPRALPTRPGDTAWPANRGRRNTTASKSRLRNSISASSPLRGRGRSARRGPQRHSRACPVRRRRSANAFSTWLQRRARTMPVAALPGASRMCRRRAISYLTPMQTCRNWGKRVTQASQVRARRSSPCAQHGNSQLWLAAEQFGREVLAEFG